MKKDYAKLVCTIFGEKSILIDHDAMNADEELGQAVEEMLEELRENEFDPMDLHYTAITDFLMEGKGQDEFAEYIRSQADELATAYIGKALRKLRHPKYSRQLHDFLRYKETD